MSSWRDWRRDEKRSVRAWLVDHPPPRQWIEGTIAYAFTEIPTHVLLSRSSRTS